MSENARLLKTQGALLNRAMVRVEALTELLTEALAVLMYESSNTPEMVEALDEKALALLGVDPDTDWRVHLASLRWLPPEERREVS